MSEDGDDAAPGRIAGSDGATEPAAATESDDDPDAGGRDGATDAGGPDGAGAAGEARVSAGIDLRAVLVRSSGYALLAAAVAFTIHTAGTVRGLGHPDPTAAVAVNVARSGGTFAVAYPIILGLNTVGRRVGATRAVAARTATPTVLWAATTVLLTLALFLPVIDAILSGSPY